MSNHLPSPPEQEYVLRFHARLTVLLRRRGVADVEDVVQTECLALIGKLAAVMADYLQPETFAAVRARGCRAAIDYQRMVSAQQGAGAVHRFDEAGHRIAGRQIVAGDAVHQDAYRDHYDERPGTRGPTGTYFDVYACERPDVEGEYVDQAEVSDQIRKALLRAEPAQRTVLLLVDGHGYTVTEVADRLGLARETVSRHRTKAYRAVRGQAAVPPC
jgi:RNA polymerase sigma factor (sigma-70 family)